MKVMIIDDSTERANGWAEQLSALGVLDSAPIIPTNKEVADALRSLNVRRLKARKEEDWRSEPCLFDGVDIVLLDFDLIDFASDSGEFATGEEIAYLARVFSTAKVLCVINQFGINRFDLTFQADTASRSDLDLGSMQISNPGLWTKPDGWIGFRPWHWPILTNEVALFSARLAEVEANFAKPVLPYFGFDPTGTQPSRALARDTLGYFQELPDKVTFASSIQSSSYVHQKDIPWLEKDEAQSARVAMAVVHRWLRKHVLIRQDVLVDAPHLVMRKPWLLLDSKNPANWSAVRGENAAALLNPRVLEFAFERSAWTLRETFWGGAIEEDQQLGLPQGKWDYAEIPDLVFREDTSDFGDRSRSLEFECGLGTSYDTRFISDPTKSEKVDGPRDTTKVEYVPSIKLLM